MGPTFHFKIAAETHAKKPGKLARGRELDLERKPATSTLTKNMMPLAIALRCLRRSLVVRQIICSGLGDRPLDACSGGGHIHADVALEARILARSEDGILHGEEGHGAYAHRTLTSGLREHVARGLVVILGQSHVHLHRDLV